MSRPRLHEQLLILFQEKSPENLKLCLENWELVSFLEKHQLNVPVSELALALTHSSFAHEYEVSHQELSEFFGDAVVQLIVTTELVRKYSKEKEGTLSKLRSSIVNEKTLACVARSLKLNELILVGKGEFKKGLLEQDVILADTMEALMAQVYKYMGIEKAAERFLQWLTTAAPEAFSLENLENYDAKSKLQEATLAKYKQLPRYSSDTHEQGFTVKLWLNENLLAEGVFPSKKIGERELARQVLTNKNF